MIPRVFRFRRFSARLLTLLLGLLFAALAATYIVVSRANEANARNHARANLELAARFVDSAIRQRIEFLALAARVMAGDYAIKQTLNDGDAATLSSLLVSYTTRISAPVITLYDLDGKLQATSERGMDDENLGPFRFLIREATEKDIPQHSGFSYLKGGLHVLVVVPLYAPYPNVVAWFGLAFPIDREFVAQVKAITRVDLTFVASDAPVLDGGKTLHDGRVLVSTLAPSNAATARAAALAITRRTDKGDAMEMVALADDRYVTFYRWQEMLGEAPITIALQRPLGPELAPARELENLLLLTALAALAVGTVLALGIARGVSQPVQQLAAHTQVIAGGDYAARISLDRADELGQLADAMNQMSIGLAERDQVRDLLDKNVSPEVAAQLMRDGAALGGQEREVTILFADLRGFTTLSEKLPPHELLALLNRYLDRMSIEIERQGGIIDKYIGDAIMALFGAPVAQGDAADRALAAALAMEHALAELNRELAIEAASIDLSSSNGPRRLILQQGLAIGVGVNTARVVAGNIGSHRRLNYSVIGDGVNVAARLQALTRTAEYRTNVIASAATLAALRDAQKFSPRPLGRTQVKGRAEAVEIFALGL